MSSSGRPTRGSSPRQPGPSVIDLWGQVLARQGLEEDLVVLHPSGGVLGKAPGDGHGQLVELLHRPPDVVGTLTSPLSAKKPPRR